MNKAKQTTKKALQSGLMVKDFEDFKSKILTTVFVVGGSYASWRFILKPQWQRYKRDHENEKTFTQASSRQASILSQAIIGSGTDEDAIMRMAKQITDWSAVQKSYQKLTGNNLNEDLKGDLSSKEYNQFMSIVNSNIKLRKASSKQGYYVVSSRAVRLRSTPDSTISSYSYNSNILTTVKAGVLLGFASGKVKLDSRGVQYYQVIIKFTKVVPYTHAAIYRKQASNTLSFWVGAGAIDLFNGLKQMRKSYPNIRLVNGIKNMRHIN
jgi:hypothetical protein